MTSKISVTTKRRRRTTKPRDSVAIASRTRRLFFGASRAESYQTSLLFRHYFAPRKKPRGERSRTSAAMPLSNPPHLPVSTNLLPFDWP